VKTIIALLKDENGQAYAEYAVLLAFITIAGIVAITALGKKIASSFNSSAALLP
jgi:Flp pilus assembly pilin Flp